uniref:ATP-dependent DNA helicase n=1 Tax=Ascaris lumbricoides TaxID=6252 RepID=A0A0M3I3Q1_ASCLU
MRFAPGEQGCAVFLEELGTGRLQDPSCNGLMRICIDADSSLKKTVLFRGTPPYNLGLKLGAVVMLLRNVDFSSGLCSGTRMVFQEMDDNTLRRLILSGTHAGEVTCHHEDTHQNVGGKMVVACALRVHSSSVV